MSSPQQHQQLHTIPPGLTNIDPALEGVVKNFMRSEKYARKIKYIVRATSVPGRQSKHLFSSSYEPIDGLIKYLNRSAI